MPLDFRSGFAELRPYIRDGQDYGIGAGDRLTGLNAVNTDFFFEPALPHFRDLHVVDRKFRVLQICCKAHAHLSTSAQQGNL